jgi:hypothetical protein
MPKIFRRIVNLKVEGEIYDNSCKPEDIINHYSWNFKNYHDHDCYDKLFIELSTKDHRGVITKISRLPKIHLYKKPDSELFLV